MLKITVDKEKCIGCGLCASIAPNSFKLNEEEGKVDPINPPKDDEQTIKSAAESCPVQSIIITSD